MSHAPGPRTPTSSPPPPPPPALDMLSEAFDAEVALLQRAGEVRLPYPAIKAVDNIMRWRSITEAQARARQKELRAQELLQQQQAAAAAAAADGSGRGTVDETAHPGHASNLQRFGLLSAAEVVARRQELQMRRLRISRHQSVLQRMQGGLGMALTGDQLDMSGNFRDGRTPIPYLKRRFRRNLSSAFLLSKSGTTRAQLRCCTTICTRGPGSGSTCGKRR